MFCFDGLCDHLCAYSLYIRYGLDSSIILDLLFYYYFNVTCKAHLNIFI